VEVTHGLRREVLGWVVPTTCIDNDDAAHLALMRGDAVVAVVSHTKWPCPDELGKPARYFWGMAVDASYRRQGAGRRLVSAVADQAHAAAESVMWADARESAVGFYVACGARVLGAPYLDEVTGLVDRRVVFTI
jgi:GNAT superfamily N-acetyltransferase